MKFRPRVQLQVRSIEQFEAMRTLAGKDAPSLNEWMLRVIEKVFPELRELEMVNGAHPAPAGVAKKVAPKPKKADVAACPDCGAVGGLHQRGCKRKGK